MRALLAYRWPGNVRELENALEYATTVCEGQTIHVGDLPSEIGQRDGRASSASARPTAGMLEPHAHAAQEAQSRIEGAPRSHVPELTQEELEEIDRIRSALAQAQYRRQEAASLLGMSRTTLWRKMKEYRL
jgi:DNA-binding NtrC family response regulator